jgi:hypothetical protein
MTGGGGKHALLAHALAALSVYGAEPCRDQAAGRPDRGGLGRPVQIQGRQEGGEIGRVFYESYHFDHDWEMVPGAWSFEIWYDGRKLTEQKLTVT